MGYEGKLRQGNRRSLLGVRESGVRISSAAPSSSAALVFEKFHLPQALLGLFFGFVGSTQVLSGLFRYDLVTAFDFLDHVDLPPQRSIVVHICWMPCLGSAERISQPIQQQPGAALG